MGSDRFQAAADVVILDLVFENVDVIPGDVIDGIGLEVVVITVVGIVVEGVIDEVVEIVVEYVNEEVIDHVVGEFHILEMMQVHNHERSHRVKDPLGMKGSPDSLHCRLLFHRTDISPGDGPCCPGDSCIPDT